MVAEWAHFTLAGITLYSTQQKVYTFFGLMRVIGPLRWVISIVTLLITLFITTYEPPSKVQQHGHALQFAADELRRSPKMVKLAVEKKGALKPQNEA